MMSVAMSPGGARLAFLTVRLNPRNWNDREAILSSMPVAGGETREMWRIENYPDGWVDHGTEWTSDGQYVILPLSGGGGKGYGAKWDLIRIPAEGGPAESLGLAGSGADPVRFPMAHPDGRQIAFDSSTWGELGRRAVGAGELPAQTAEDRLSVSSPRKHHVEAHSFRSGRRGPSNRCPARADGIDRGRPYRSACGSSAGSGAGRALAGKYTAEPGAGGPEMTPLVSSAVPDLR